MSTTIVDMPKVTQMLDNGWTVSLYRNDLGSYTAVGRTDSEAMWERARDKIHDIIRNAGHSHETAEAICENTMDEPGEVDTDDFTPEQALTRLAYKVHGEII